MTQMTQTTKGVKMKALKDYTDQELKQTFADLEDSIFNIECYGVRDMLMLLGIGAELEKRGYEAEKQKTLTEWIKESEEGGVR